MALIPRAIRLPFLLPVRAIHITIVKVQGGWDSCVVRAKWAVRLTADQKAKLMEHLASRSHAIADRATSSSIATNVRYGREGVSRKMQAALQSIAHGKKAVGVQCYKVCERFHII